MHLIISALDYWYNENLVFNFCSVIKEALFKISTDVDRSANGMFLSAHTIHSKVTHRLTVQSPASYVTDFTNDVKTSNQYRH